MLELPVFHGELSHACPTGRWTQVINFEFWALFSYLNKAQLEAWRKPFFRMQKKTLLGSHIFKSFPTCVKSVCKVGTPPTDGEVPVPISKVGSSDKVRYADCPAYTGVHCHPRLSPRLVAQCSSPFSQGTLGNVWGRGVSEWSVSSQRSEMVLTIRQHVAQPNTRIIWSNLLRSFIKLVRHMTTIIHECFQ